VWFEKILAVDAFGNWKNAKKCLDMPRNAASLAE